MQPLPPRGEEETAGGGQVEQPPEQRLLEGDADEVGEGVVGHPKQTGLAGGSEEPLQSPSEAKEEQADENRESSTEQLLHVQHPRHSLAP